MALEKGTGVGDAVPAVHHNISDEPGLRPDQLAQHPLRAAMTIIDAEHPHRGQACRRLPWHPRRGGGHGRPGWAVEEAAPEVESEDGRARQQQHPRAGSSLLHPQGLCKVG